MYKCYVYTYEKHNLILYFMLLDSAGCENVTCPGGSQCKINQTTSQAYCEASCDLDNGGCANNEVCSLQQQQQTCSNGPCPLVVHCSSELIFVSITPILSVCLYF